VYAKVRREVVAAGLDVLQVAELDPYEADHAAVLVERS
jgi:fibrillarin-like rRNA methylase